MATAGSAAFFMQEAKALNIKLKEAQARYLQISEIIGSLLKYDLAVTKNKLEKVNDKAMAAKIMSIYNQFQAQKVKNQQTITCINTIVFPLHKIAKNDEILHPSIKNYPKQCEKFISSKSLSQIIRLTNNSKVLFGAIDTKQEKTKEYYDQFGSQFLYIYADKILETKKQNAWIPEQIFIQQLNLVINGKFQKQNCKLKKYLSQECIDIVQQLQTKILQNNAEIKKIQLQFFNKISISTKQNQALLNLLNVLKQENNNIISQSQQFDSIHTKNNHKDEYLIQQLSKDNKKLQEKCQTYQVQLNKKQGSLKELYNIKQQLKIKDKIINELLQMKEANCQFEEKVRALGKQIEILKKSNKQLVNNPFNLQLVSLNNLQRQQIFKLNQNIVLIRKQTLVKCNEYNNIFKFIKSQIQIAFSWLINEQKEIQESKQFILGEINTIIRSFVESIDQAQNNLDNSKCQDSNLQEGYSNNNILGSLAMK